MSTPVRDIAAADEKILRSSIREHGKHLAMIEERLSLVESIAHDMEAMRVSNEEIRRDMEKLRIDMAAILNRFMKSAP